MKNIKELGLELIELEDQVLLIEKEVSLSNNGDYYIPYGSKKGTIHKWNMEGMHEGKQVWINKIITSTKPLEGLPLLVIEDEIVKFVEENYTMEVGNFQMNSIVSEQRRAFKEGYNKAKSTYKFTEEDLRGIFLMGLMENISSILKERSLEKEEIIVLFQKYMQSLTKKELWVEVELDQINVNHKTGHEVNKVIPKISQGKIKAIWK